MITLKGELEVDLELCTYNVIPSILSTTYYLVVHVCIRYVGRAACTAMPRAEGE